jgi:hypothetical protein
MQERGFQMRRTTFWALAACVAAAGLSGARASRAESFAGYTLTGDNGYNLVGIDSKGNVAIHSASGYDIFNAGRLVSQSSALTNFTPEDGIACAFAPMAAEVQSGQSVCNGGNQVVGVQMNGASEIVYVSYTGTDVVTVGTADLLFVNTAGDFVLVDGLDQEIREFTPTPELGSLALLATAGGAGAVLLHRRKQVQ